MTIDFPGLLPGTLRDDHPPGRRSRRDWTVDAVVFLAAGIGIALGYHLGDQATVGPDRAMPWAVLDVALGVVTTLSLWWRRSRPVAVAVLAIVVTPFSAASGVAMLAILFSTLLHLPYRRSAPLAVLLFASSCLQPAIRPQAQGLVSWLLANAAIYGVVVAWALYVRARRQLVVTVRDRADQAVAEQQLHTDRARLTERARIAGEMHGAVAERIRLIEQRADVLAADEPLTVEDRQAAAALIRTTARSALEELREVIGVLRSDPAAEATPAGAASSVPPPQPTISDLTRLADQRNAPTEVSVDLPADPPVPDGVGRTTFRIVQDILTGWPPAATLPGQVQVSGRPGVGVQVTVRVTTSDLTSDVDRLDRPDRPEQLDGLEALLVGLRERVTVAGGTLRHSSAPAELVVEADLPWETT